ncbi:AAA ATPase domain-containing protein [Heterostelium album PN500]|uniref:AAA ATPase domain-containing protein n=1 Tax=Heterostelium pallidum (strain ATCC 26659 / Pp 5 / PN500) TaxID=670386 RepID=D3BKM7_HETP5|nr:AAA ATPase domain-containing protein [Heterostelium album PN500]EFA78457.1 AAA ATPase domain-containing protein [Heterostelium album PN500]|eukprot:XP_020430581.1 AAA ATPase domain-containing protein [Heterostelium album PN500]
MVMKKSSNLYDSKLVERIESLDFSGNAYLDADTIATKLRSQFSEYNRKQYKPFLTQVERAIQVIMKSTDEYIDDPEFDDDENVDNNNNNTTPNTPNTVEINLDQPPQDDKMMSEDGHDSDIEFISETKLITKQQQNNKQQQQQQQNNSLNQTILSNYSKSDSKSKSLTPPTTPPVYVSNNPLGKRSRDVVTSTPTTPIKSDTVAADQQPQTPNDTLKKQRRLKQSQTSVASDRNPLATSKDSSSLAKVGTIPSVDFSNMGGIEQVLKDIREQIEYPINHPEVYRHLGADPPRGILLHGPPGTGKTLLANAIAGELKIPLISISAPEIASGLSGESESKIRGLFASAQEQAPCIVFIDEIDAIAPKRENASKEMERRIVAQLLTCMDSLNMRASTSNTNYQSTRSSNINEQQQQQQQSTNSNNNNNNNEQQQQQIESIVQKNNGHIMVIGATSRPESIDPALRMGGRFDREMALGVPDLVAREKILRVLTSRMRLSKDFDYQEIASLTPGYVGADVNLLAKTAATFSIVRAFSQANMDTPEKMKQPFDASQLDQLYIEMADFKNAVKKVQPSAKREGFATIPNVTWDDIGALRSIREELTKTILRPIRHPATYKGLGIDSPAGVLMYGPPGCGKTLLAKAIASECQANFISVKGPELLNKYVGESERAVRQVFQRASASAPCVIFFDEFDALAPKRGTDGGNQATERVVNQLLTEMDGLEKRSEVFIVAATNRPDIIDSAMLRPGRLDKLLYVPLPSPEERVEILKTVTAKIPLDADVDLAAVGTDSRCHAFSGADLSLLVKEAAMSALDKVFERQEDADAKETVKPKVSMDDFTYALNKTKPSVSKKDELMYDRLNLNIKQTRDQIAKEKKKPVSTITPTPTTNSNNNDQNGTDKVATNDKDPMVLA